MKDLASEIEAEFAPKQNGELLRDSAAAARMRILEEERNAAVLEAERARKERDCALERERVVLEQLHEARRVGSRLALEQTEGAAERDRLKAALDDARASYLQAASAPWASRALALENELNKTRAEWRDAVRATAEAKSMLANLEVSAQEADREAAERESGLLGELAEVKDALAMVHEALEAVTEREAALREERDRLIPELQGAYMAEIRNARKAAEEEREAHARTTEAHRQLVAFFECARKAAKEEREAHARTTEAHRLVCLALTYEKGSHAVTRAMLKLAIAEHAIKS